MQAFRPTIHPTVRPGAPAPADTPPPKPTRSAEAHRLPAGPDPLIPLVRPNVTAPGGFTTPRRNAALSVSSTGIALRRPATMPRPMPVPAPSASSSRAAQQGVTRDDRLTTLAKGLPNLVSLLGPNGGAADLGSIGAQVQRWLDEKLPAATPPGAQASPRREVAESLLARLTSPTLKVAEAEDYGAALRQARLLDLTRGALGEADQARAEAAVATLIRQPVPFRMTREQGNAAMELMHSLAQTGASAPTPHLALAASYAEEGYRSLFPEIEKLSRNVPGLGTLRKAELDIRLRQMDQGEGGEGSRLH